MKIKSFSLLFFFLFFFFSCSIQSFAAEAADPPDVNSLHAASALLMDGKSGRVLYEKNGYEALPMASTTKIMTCLYALEHADLSSTVTVSKRASQAPKVKLDMKEGETYQFSDLLYSLMLESHNDTAIAIAEATEGSVETFCEKMTEEARSFGCQDTIFETPNGLDSQNHHTTAYDLALITRQALKNQTFREIIKTSSYSFSTLDGNRSFTVSNHDAFLNLYDGAIGVKTGFTGKAGYCFVGAVEDSDRLFLSVVLASGWPPNKTYKWADTKKLMDYGTANYEMKTLLTPDSISLPNLSVEDGITASLSLYLKDSVSFLVSDKEQVRIVTNLPDTLTAPVEKDTAIGNVELYIDDTLLATVPVYTKNSSEKITFRYCLNRIFTSFLYGFFTEKLF